MVLDCSDFQHRQSLSVHQDTNVHIWTTHTYIHMQPHFLWHQKPLVTGGLVWTRGSWDKSCRNTVKKGLTGKHNLSFKHLSQVQRCRHCVNIFITWYSSCLFFSVSFFFLCLKYFIAVKCSLYQLCLLSVSCRICIMFIYLLFLRLSKIYSFNIIYWREAINWAWLIIIYHVLLFILSGIIKK